MHSLLTTANYRIGIPLARADALGIRARYRVPGANVVGP